MVSVALFVDELKLWVLWALLLVVFYWLHLWFFKVLSDPEATAGERRIIRPGRATWLERLDERACLAISRRPRRRKRRHRHRSRRSVALVAA
jgi:hypothetical protein